MCLFVVVAVYLLVVIVVTVVIGGCVVLVVMALFGVVLVKVGRSLFASVEEKVMQLRDMVPFIRYSNGRPDDGT
jgi:hypothetical protein